MSDRERAQKRSTEESAEVSHDAVTNQGEEIADKIDDLLDEIDSVLEENAEEFIKNYVQKGGQ